MYLTGDGSGPDHSRLSRRSFIKFGLFATGAALFPSSAFAAASVPVAAEKSISFYNVHTGESLDTVYWYKGKYLSGALGEINYILRDFRAEEIKSIDTGLLDLLCAIRMKLHPRDPFHIFSGYRSPTTNALLRRRRKGVSKNSLHIHGKAADIHLPKIRLSSLRRVAMSMRAGGVGYYPRNGFVHVDVGPVRYWRC